MTPQVKLALHTTMGACPKRTKKKYFIGGWIVCLRPLLPTKLLGDKCHCRYCFLLKSAATKRTSLHDQRPLNHERPMYMMMIGSRLAQSIPSISISSTGDAGGVGGSWHSCIVLSLLVIRPKMSWALARRAVRSCTFSKATIWRLCSVA